MSNGLLNPTLGKTLKTQLSWFTRNIHSLPTLHDVSLFEAKTASRRSNARRYPSFLLSRKQQPQFCHTYKSSDTMVQDISEQVLSVDAIMCSTSSQNIDAMNDTTHGTAILLSRIRSDIVKNLCVNILEPFSSPILFNKATAPYPSFWT